MACYNYNGESDSSGWIPKDFKHYISMLPSCFKEHLMSLAGLVNITWIDGYIEEKGLLRARGRVNKDVKKRL